MNHIDTYITDYLDNTLDVAAREKVKSHLVFCIECQQKIAELSLIINSLNSTARVSVPVGLEQKIFTKLRKNENFASLTWSDSFKDFFAGFNWKIVSLTMASFLGVFVVFKMKNSTQTPLNSIPSPIGFLQERVDAKQNVLDNKKERRKLDLLQKTLSLDDFKNEEFKKNPSKAGVEKRDMPMENNHKFADKISNFADGKDREEVGLNRLQAKGIGGAIPEKPAVPPVTTLSSASRYRGTIIGDKRQAVNGEKAKSLEDSDSSNERIIQDETSFNQLIRELNVDSFPVNFEEEDVLAIILTDAASGSTISLDLLETIEIKGELTRVVSYRVIEAELDSSEPHEKSRPYLLKAIPKFSAKTIFHKNP